MTVDQQPALNTDPPEVRCGTCSSRCRWEGKGWISCASCAWSSHNPDRTGFVWWLRVQLGWRTGWSPLRARWSAQRFYRVPGDQERDDDISGNIRLSTGKAYYFLTRGAAERRRRMLERSMPHGTGFVRVEHRG